MNKANSEQILESFLGEYLGDELPTPINIEQLQQTVIGSDLSSRLEDASTFATNGWTLASLQQTSKPRQSRSKTGRMLVSSKNSKRLKTRKPSLWSNRTIYLLSGVAAGALLAVGSWNYLPNAWQIDAKKLSQQATRENSRKPMTLPQLNFDAIASSDGNSKHSEATQPPEILSMDAVPFPKNGLDENSAANSSKTASDKEKRSLESAEVLLGPNELVSLVDDQLEYLWHRQGITPAPSIEDDQWIQRASLRITGRPISSDDKAAFLADESGLRRQNWLDRATASDDFYRYWTNRFADSILPKTEDSESAKSRPERILFKQWVASQLQATVPIDQIVKQILVARGSLATASADHSPQAYWWAQVAANNDHSRATNAIASNLLGQHGSCARCHDPSAGIAQLPNQITPNQKLPVSENGDREPLSRSQYWNLASVVSGVQVRAASGPKLESEKLASEKPEPEIIAANQTSADQFSNQEVGYSEDWNTLFYEQSDRSLVAAVAKLPNGTVLDGPSVNREAETTAIRSNIERLAAWLTSSPAFDARQVNWVWESLLGQPLETRYKLADSDGLSERQELLETLASQWRKSGFDLRKLIKALALTKAFDREVVQCDPVWYITSTPQQLADYQNRQLLFASFPAATDLSFRSIGNVAQWFRRSHSSVLGQATPQALNLSKPSEATAAVNGTVSESADDVSAAQTQFIIRSRVLPNGLSQQVDRWLQSSMPWEELVDHAFYMANDAAASDQEQAFARELLSSTRDRRQAIQRILASQLP